MTTYLEGTPPPVPLSPSFDEYGGLACHVEDIGLRLTDLREGDTEELILTAAVAQAKDRAARLGITPGAVEAGIASVNADTGIIHIQILFHPGLKDQRRNA